MKQIGKFIPADIDERIQRAAEAIEKTKEENVKRFGWNPDCDCHECGDTGYRLGTQEFCWCESGRRLEADRRRFNKWDELIPRKFRGLHLDYHPNQNLVAGCKKWFRDDYPRRRNLIITGSYGSGKTSAAIGILSNLYFDYGVNVLFGTFAEMLDQIRAGFDKGAADSGDLTMFRLQGVPVLVVDDLGAEKPSEWVSERLYQIVNDRYQWQRPTIFTTNLDQKAIEQRVGKRTSDRIFDSAIVLEADGNHRDGAVSIDISRLIE